MSSFVVGALFAGFASLSWATGAVFARLGMRRVGSVTGTFISLVAGILVITTITLASQAEALLEVSGQTLLWCLLLGVVQFPLARFLNYNGIHLAGVAPATAITGTNPLFAALLALAFLGESVTVLLLVGTVSVVAGLILVTTERAARQWPGGKPSRAALPSEPETGWVRRIRGPLLLGLLCSLGSAVAYGGVHTLARHLVTGGSPAAVTATYTLLFGTAVLLCAGARRIVSEIRAPGPDLLLMGAAGVCSAFGTLFIYSSLGRISVTVASSIAASYPIVTLLLTHCFLQRLERVTPRMALGAILAVMGVGLVLLG